MQTLPVPKIHERLGVGNPARLSPVGQRQGMANDLVALFLRPLLEAFLGVFLAQLSHDARDDGRASLDLLFTVGNADHAQDGAGEGGPSDR